MWGVELNNTVKKHMYPLSLYANVIHFVSNVIPSFGAMISKKKENNDAKHQFMAHTVYRVTRVIYTNDISLFQNAAISFVV